MEKKLNYLLLFLFILINCNIGFSQSSVHISDLNPGVEIDSTMSVTGEIRLFINFKIDDVSQADSVFFMFGTTKGGSEIFKENGKFQKTGSNHFVKTQGSDYQIINTEASCKVNIGETQYNSSPYLSMVVKDKSGLYTNTLHIRIN
ncbi:MAG: hypothetical protein ACT4ON_15815 [Bacteroidota bacterium]